MWERTPVRSHTPLKHTNRKDKMSGHDRARLRAALAITVAAIATLLTALPAHALPGRGHAHSSTFGSSGAGDGELSAPGPVAVSESTGDVYVLDRSNDRIEQFGPEGQFISAWGWGVNAHGSKGSYEVCTSECHAGADHRGFQLTGAQAIAVDNCTHEGTPCTTAEDPSVGDVYVLAPREHEEEAYEALEKYSPDGKQLERATKIVSQEGGEKEKLEELEAQETHGLAVGPEGTPWLYYEETLYPLNNNTLKQPGSQQPLTFTLGGEPANGLALDGSGAFYIAQTLLPGTSGARQVISKWTLIPGEQELNETSEALSDEDTTAVAADEDTGEAYLQHPAATSAYTPAGVLIEHFGQGILSQGAGVAVDSHTRTVYVADAASSDVEVFKPEEPAAPSIESLSAQDISSETAQLDATIDPRGATQKTSYHFSYGTAPCTSPSACAEVPGGELGGQAFAEEGFGEADVSVQLGSGTDAPLAPDTTYHYRVVAKNEIGETRSTQEERFSTPPAKGSFIADVRGWEIVSPVEKDGALVQALTRAGGTIQAAADGGAITYVTDAPVGQVSGNRSPEPTQMLSTRGPGGWETQDIVTPNEHGSGIGAAEGGEYRSFSEDLSLALVAPRFNLGSMAEPPLSPPLTAAEESEGQQNTPYLRADTYADGAPLPHTEAVQAIYTQAEENGHSEGNSGYVALLSALDTMEEAHFGSSELGHAVHFLDASRDLNQLVLYSELQGEPGCTQGLLGCTPGLYEWSESHLHLISLLPGETPAADATLGAGGGAGAGAAGGANGNEDLRHAISNDGSRVFWSVGGHLYMRDTSTPPQDPQREETIQLDRARPPLQEPASGGAVFQSASADGSRVFFADTERLTEESGEAGTPDLYVCEIIENTSHKLECKLSDLTPAQHTAKGTESAEVQGVGFPQGGVLGASEDGSTLYFVANGVLSETANAQGEKAAPGLCSVERHPEHICNLYMERHASEAHNPGWPAHPTFIASLSGEDYPDWQGLAAPAIYGTFTSRVSPNGMHLAFMSERELSGYDNRDTNPEAHGAHDEEVFQFTAPSAAEEEHGEPGRLVCASCDPSGARPAGVLDPPEDDDNGPEGVGLLVDRPGTWAGKWLAGSIPGWTRLAEHGAAPYYLYQSRYLSDSGRLLFTSPADLVAEATNAKEDVYEYEPQGVPRGRHVCTGQSATFDAPAEGCLGLISSGTSTRESAFLDASESGGEGPNGETLSEGAGDVFFITAAPLAPQDTDSEFDVYDAHECTTGSPCVVPAEEEPPPDCQSTDACRTNTPPPSSPLGSPASAAPGAAGNLAPQQAVLPSKTTGKPKPKPLTRAQKLAKALKSCRVEHRHSRSRRIACEKQARRRYAPAKKATRKGKR
jgi:hypothetical protein